MGNEYLIPLTWQASATETDPLKNGLTDVLNQDECTLWIH